MPKQFEHTMEVTITVTITPPRPAPICHNPDSNAFSDPGDSAEIENIVVEGCPEALAEAIRDAIYDKDEVFNSVLEDALDNSGEGPDEYDD